MWQSCVGSGDAARTCAVDGPADSLPSQSLVVGIAFTRVGAALACAIGARIQLAIVVGTTRGGGCVKRKGSEVDGAAGGWRTLV